MRKKFFGLGLLFILVHNLFANDVSYMNTKWWKEMLKCEVNGNSKQVARKAPVQNCLNVISVLSNKHNRTKTEQELLGEAYYNAGVIYDFKNHYKSAVKMYKKSIKNGYCKYNNCSVKLNLGILYYEGKGVPKNHKKAYQLFKDASRHGSTNAKIALSMLCQESPWVCK